MVQCINNVDTFNFAHVFYRGELQLMGGKGNGAFIIRPRVIHARSNFKTFFKHVCWGVGSLGSSLERIIFDSDGFRALSCLKTSRFFQPTQPPNLPSVHVCKEHDAHPNEL